MPHVSIGHPTANQFFRHTVSAMHRIGVLAVAATGVDGGRLLRRFGGILPAGIKRELARRSFVNELWENRLLSRPGLESCRLLAQWLRWTRLHKGEHARFSVDRVFHDFDRWMARLLPNPNQVSAFKSQISQESAVYCYEDGALATFTRAKALGVLCVYDLPIAYWETLRRLIAEERERLPEWAETLGGGLTDSQAKLDRKTRELELADVVIVPSQFVADSLPEWARATKRVVISPFGSPGSEAAVPVAAEPHGGEQGSPGRQQSCHGGTVGGKAAAVDGAAKQQLRGVAATERAQPAPTTVLQSNNRTAKRPLRVLFAGSMGQRKGLGDLMAAVRMLNRPDVEFVCMGSLLAPMEFYQQQCPGFTYEKGRPHAEVLELMRSCDVFCLPSIVEGRALVMQEAMSQGLPIIITPNTGGADLVSDAYQIGGCGAAATVAPTAHGGEQGSHGETVDCAAEQQLRGEAPTERMQPAPATGSHGDHRAAKQSPHREAMTAQRSATGFLVPIRSPEAIAEAIAWCADHRDEVAAMGRAAQAKAAEYTWEEYGNRIVEAIREECSKAARSRA